MRLHAPYHPSQTRGSGRVPKVLATKVQLVFELLPERLQKHI
jgi:hypothetical protein